MSDRLEEIKKRLEKNIDYTADAPWQSSKDLHWLIAEVELWRKPWDSESDEADVLRDQLDEARADLAAAQTGFQAALKDLGEARAEVERLRDALERASECINDAAFPTQSEIIRKALEGNDG